MTLNEYNGIVMMEVNHLSGRTEADEIKELVKEFPQTFLAFTGSSGKSVKIWVRFTYPDDRLPVSREQVELFHAHAYQTAVKYYQPQLPFDIELKEPLLEQYCRLTYDPELYFNPEAMPIYMKQPVSLPSETAFIRRTRETDSPLQRMAPGYENYEALSVLFSAAFNRALEELDGYRASAINPPSPSPSRTDTCVKGTSKSSAQVRVIPTSSPCAEGKCWKRQILSSTPAVSSPAN